VEFAVETFPPVDETTIALRVQLALCARSLANEESIVKMEQAKKNKKKEEGTGKWWLSGYGCGRGRGRGEDCPRKCQGGIEDA